MSAFERVALLFIAIITGAACFAEWVAYGDPIPTFRRGVDVTSSFLLDGSFADNGGGKILITLALVILLTFSAAKSPRRWPTYLVGLGATLSGFSVYEVVRFWLWQRHLIGVIGSPVPMMGLHVVVAGSVLILLVAIRSYRACRRVETQTLP
jgi:hypothetical protein